MTPADGERHEMRRTFYLKQNKKTTYRVNLTSEYT